MREISTVPFDDLVYLLAEGVADAQTRLDLNAIETLETLAETEVDVVPKLTRTVETDGTVTTESAPTQSRSMLELGLAPARYQFSDATVEIEVDVTAASHERLDDERTDRSSGLQAATRAVIEQRKYDREIGANARIAARLVPTPLPIDVGSPEGSDEVSGGAHAN